MCTRKGFRNGSPKCLIRWTIKILVELIAVHSAGSDDDLSAFLAKNSSLSKIGPLVAKFTCLHRDWAQCTVLTIRKRVVSHVVV